MNYRKSAVIFILMTFYSINADSSYPGENLILNSDQGLEELFPQLNDILNPPIDWDILESSPPTLKRAAADELTQPKESKICKVSLLVLPTIELTSEEQTKVYTTAYRSFCNRSPEKTILVLKAAEELLCQDKDFSYAEIIELVKMADTAMTQMLANLTTKQWLERTQQKGRKFSHKITPEGRFALRILEKFQDNIKSMPQEYLSKVTIGGDK